MFKPVSKRFNVTLLEEEIMRLWKTQRVFAKRRNLHQDAPLFVIYERPPLADGKSNLQDALERVHQDLWLRYKTMRGLHVMRHHGWAAHGLTIELQAAARLGFTSNRQIESYGLANFNDLCRQLALASIQNRESLDERLNGWEEDRAAPSTHENPAIEAVWNLFKQAWDRGLVYLDEGIAPLCPHCGTVLADYETTLGVKIIDSMADYLHVPLLENPDTSLLVWTEQTWSLLGNVAIAVNPDAEYVIVERDLPESEASKDHKSEKLILARNLLDRGFGNETVRVYETFRGSKLKGLKYRPLFQFLLAEKPAYRLILDELFITESGSGLKQLAPAFDARALKLAKENDLPVLSPLGPDGIFLPEIRPWRGMFFKDAEAYIRQDLQERGLLICSETYSRSAEFCWACQTPLLPYIQKAWYLRTRNPGSAWAIGRDRFWGTPLPLWQCIKCGHQLAVPSLEELSHLAGRSLAELDLHRPSVDEVGFPCPECEGLMRRQPQVMDAALDSAVLSLLQLPGQEQPTYPSDILCESPQQSQSWLYALNQLSELLYDEPAYRRLLSLPTLSEASDDSASIDQPALSDPWDVIHDHGADALRWVFLSDCASGEQVSFSNEHLVAARRDFLLPLWETYALLVNSAIQVGWKPRTSEPPGASSSAILDRWLLSRLNNLIVEMTAALEDYDTPRAASRLQAFVIDLATWYAPLSRQRFSDKATLESRQAACESLYQVMATFSRLLSPFIPFLAEEIYQKLVRSFDLSAPVSVHLTDWPVADEALIDGEHLNRIARLQEITSLGQSAREEAGIVPRQSLPGAVVTLASAEEAEALESFTDLLAVALRVRQVRLEVDPSLAAPDGLRISLDTHLTVELMQEGLADEFIRRVLDFCQKAGYSEAASIRLFINATPRLAEAISALQAHIAEEAHCIDLKLVSQQPGISTGVEQGHTSRRLYTMAEFDGERVTFGVERA